MSIPVKKISPVLSFIKVETSYMSEIVLMSIDGNRVFSSVSVFISLRVLKQGYFEFRTLNLICIKSTQCFTK